jgi:hypothetical protein
MLRSRGRRPRRSSVGARHRGRGSVFGRRAGEVAVAPLAGWAILRVLAYSYRGSDAHTA